MLKVGALMMLILVPSLSILWKKMIRLIHRDMGENGYRINDFFKKLKYS